MSASKAQIKANNKYNKNNYDRLNLIVPKGQKAIIQEYAKSQGKSLNSYVIDLIKIDLDNKGFMVDEEEEKGTEQSTEEIQE